MSIHAKISPEAAAELTAQKRSSTISSAIIAILAMAIIGAVLWAISLVPKFKNNEVTVTRTATTEPEDAPKPPELKDQETVIEPSITYGIGDSEGDIFGNGWETGSDKRKGKGGGTRIFEPTSDRVVYVIDYSLSMRGEKIALLKKELTQSIETLPDGVQYQIIFFWVNKAQNDWSRKGKKQKVAWIVADDSTRAQSIKSTQETPLAWGTTWNDPLEMAINISPSPEQIFFMTDGLTGTGASGAIKTAKKIGAKASNKSITINTIALLAPTAEEALQHLADVTGGNYKLVNR